MHQRPRQGSRGVSFGGHSPAYTPSPQGEHGGRHEPPHKKRKLSEASSSANGDDIDARSRGGHDGPRYHYQLGTPMVLGAQPEIFDVETLIPPQALSDADRAASVPVDAAFTIHGTPLPEVTAEPVIHFKKPSLRSLASSATPYKPATGANASSSSKEGGDSSVRERPPWSKKDYEAGVTGLDEEVRDFYAFLQPTKEERMLRLDLVERLRQTIRSRWSKAEVRFFGSFATDLLLPTSDIDVVVLGVPPIQSNLWIVRSLLQRNQFSDAPNVIAHAKVPLVKFTDTLTGIEVDISFDQPNGLRNTNLINAFAAKFDAFRPLLLTVKYLLHQLSMNEPYNGGLGSYSLSLMIASFLQMHPKTNNSTGTTEPNLGFLLLDFLSLYGKHFNFYHTGISIRNDGSYFSKFERGWIDPNQPFLPSIEDPNDVENDVGRSSFRILNIRSVFKETHTKLANIPKTPTIVPSLLGRVLLPDHAVLHARSHHPALVSELQKTKEFMRHTKPVEDLYDAAGRLKPDADPTSLSRLHGDAQFFSPIHDPKPVSVKDYQSVKAGGRHHVMLDFDTDDDDDDVYVTTPSSSSTKKGSTPSRFVYIADSDEEEAENEIMVPDSPGSDDDHVQPIVISDDDDDDDEMSHPKTRPSKSDKNSKKRKR